MTLSSIKSMFAPGAYWSVEYSGEVGKRTPYRQVHKVRGNEIVWFTGSASKYHTTWPKASEIIQAEPGLLVFRYNEHRETFTFRLLSGAEADAAAAYLADASIRDQELRAEQKRQSEETKNRLDAEARKSREDKIRNRQPVSAWELIEAMRENSIDISPSTVGTLRKKVSSVSPNSWTIVHRVKPRFSYETQPSILYMKVHDHLLLQDLAEPVSHIQEATDAELSHLFGLTQEANVTSQPPMVETPTTALDLFAA